MIKFKHILNCFTRTKSKQNTFKMFFSNLSNAYVQNNYFTNLTWLPVLDEMMAEGLQGNEVYT